MKELISIILLCLGTIVVIGTLCISVLTNNTMPFLIGYPSGIVMLLAVWMLDKKIK